MKTFVLLLVTVSMFLCSSCATSSPGLTAIAQGLHTVTTAATMVRPFLPTPLGFIRCSECHAEASAGKGTASVE